MRRDEAPQQGKCQQDAIVSQQKPRRGLFTKIAAGHLLRFKDGFNSCRLPRKQCCASTCTRQARVGYLSRSGFSSRESSGWIRFHVFSCKIDLLVRKRKKTSTAPHIFGPFAVIQVHCGVFQPMALSSRASFLFPKYMSSSWPSPGLEGADLGPANQGKYPEADLTDITRKVALLGPMPSQVEPDSSHPGLVCDMPTWSCRGWS